MSENFYYVEGSSSVKNLIKSLATEITQNASIYNWGLIYPTDVASIDDFTIIKATTSYGKSFYVRLERTTIINPTDSDKLLLQKEKNSTPLSDTELKLIARYMESTAFTSTELALIKKDPTTLTTIEQEALQDLRVTKNIRKDEELTLLRRYYNGDSLTTDEQNKLTTYRDLHDLTAQELADLNTLRTNRQLYYDYILIIMYKQGMGITLDQSEQSSLASYRSSMELSQGERERLAIIKGQMNNKNYIYVTIGKDIHDTTRTITVDGNSTTINVKDLVEETCSVPSRLSWYKSLATNIGDWLPVQYWINVTKDAVNIVLRGDPSADSYPYNNYLTSYCYLGAVKPMEDSAFTDDEYNFGVTTSSDIQPIFSDKFGARTATGITDVCMIGNKIGMPMQPHYPGFYTTHAFMDKCNTEGSRWNHKKHQFSDIVLVHPVDMERGKMINVLVGDSSAIYDMDKLVYKKDTAEEENYKKFKINAPFCLLNNSANNLYCIAIRCYKTAE